MDEQQKPESRLNDTQVPVRMKLSFLWVSAMLCYIYCDYFELYVPGKLQSMLEGLFGPPGGPLAAATMTQSVLLGSAVLMAFPSLMVFLSIALPPTLCRLANIGFDIVYSIIVALVAFRSTWAFYRFVGLVEIVLTLFVVWYAWTWPRRSLCEPRS
jgi:hypothetical protein